MGSKPSKSFDLQSFDYWVLLFDLKSKTNPEYDTAKQAKEYLKFLKNPKFSYYLHFFQDLMYALKGLSSSFKATAY